MKNKFIAWARVSSQRQQEEGWSLEYQEEKLKEYAARNDGVIVKLYVVTETASKHLERTTFQEMLRFAKSQSGQLDGLLVMKIDRAARNMRDFVALETLEEEHGIRLISVTQPTENTPSGKMMRRTFATFATFFTEQLSVDVKTAMKRRAEAGWFVTLAPYGYRNIQVDKRRIVEVQQDQAASVRRIFQLYAYHSHTLDSLRDAIHAEGLQYTIAQPLFGRSKIYEILTDRSYIGDVDHRGTWLPGVHQPIVDRSTFDRVQVLLRRKTHHSHDFVYSSMIVCGHCSRPICGEGKTKKTSSGIRQYTYYRCSRYNANDHPRIRLTEQQVDAQLFALFDRIRIEDEEVRGIVADIIRGQVRAEQSDGIERRQRLGVDLARIRGQKDQLLNLRLCEEIDAATYATKSRELRDREAVLAVEVDDAGRDQSEMAELAIKSFELSQNLRAKWVNADMDAKRGILEILCLNLTLNDVSLVATMREPFDRMAEGFNFALSAQDRTMLGSAQAFISGCHRIPLAICRMILAA